MRMIKKNGIALDIYMTSTLALIGISIAIIQIDTIYYVIKGESLPDVLNVLVTGYP